MSGRFIADLALQGLGVPCSCAPCNLVVLGLGNILEEKQKVLGCSVFEHLLAVWQLLGAIDVWIIFD